VIETKGSINFFLANLRGGGIQKVTLQLLRELIRRELSPVLVVVDAGGPNRANVPKDCRLVDLGSERVRNAIFPLLNYLRINKPSLAISSQTHLNVALILIRAITGYPKKLIVCEHITFNEEIVKSGAFIERMRTWMIRLLYPFASAFVAVSQSSAASIRRFAKYKKPIRVIRNGIDLEEIQQLKGIKMVSANLVLSSSQKMIVGLGRLSYQKNFSDLLKAFTLLEGREDYRLVIMGEGSRKEMLASMACDLQIADWVHFPGYLLNPYPVLAAADLFVLSSRWEGFALVVLEALACGLPIVATDCPGGPAEILRGKSFTRVVPVGDQAAMAAAISDLLEQNIDRSEIIQYAHDFSIGRMADSYLKLMAEVSQVEV